MPMAIPLVASAFSISAGLSAGGMLGGLMVAGGALGGLGAITGNKKLMTLGSILGLAGGVGGALGLGETAAKEIAKNGITDAAGQAAADAARSTADNTIGSVTGTTSGGVSEAAKAAGNAASSSGGVDSGLYDKVVSGTSGGVPDVSQRFPSLSDVNAAPKPPGVLDQLNSVWNGPSGAGSGVMDKISNTANTLLDGSKGLISGASDWIKANPDAAKIGGGLVYGAMNYAGNQQLAEDNLKRQMRYSDWVRQRYSDSVRNLQIPSPLSTGTAPAGMIASSRG